MTNHEPERRAALEAVRQASRICRAVQRELAGTVLHKNDKSPVTVADWASQAVVCQALARAFPRDPVVGEEEAAALREPANAALLARVVARVGGVVPGASADEVCAWIDRGGHPAGAPRLWTLDPIDGTKGFLRGEQYAVALALLEGGQVVVAALGCPNLEHGQGRGAIFTAVRGDGARVEPLDGGAASPVEVSATSDPALARFCESVEEGHSAHDVSALVAKAAGIVKPSVRLDSQAKYAVVARGEAEAYLRFSRGGHVEKIWDHAAGYLVCVEAGGRASDLDGKELDFGRGKRLERNRGVLVTNGALHDRLLAAIRTAEPKE